MPHARTTSLGFHVRMSVPSLTLPTLPQRIRNSSETSYARTISGQAERWLQDKLAQLRGLPWALGAPDEPGPSAEQELRPIINGRQVGEPSSAEGEQRGDGEIRNFKIFKSDLANPEVGYTLGCGGCSAARQGTAPKPHNA